MAPKEEKNDAESGGDSNQEAIDRIWDFLRRPDRYKDPDIRWPVADVMAHYKNVILEHERTAGHLPVPIAMMLEFDFRQYPTTGERSDHASCFMSSDKIGNMHPFWRKILHRIMFDFMNAARARTESKITEIAVKTISGYYACDSDEEEEEPPDDQTNSNQSQEYQMDLNQSIRAITSIFPTQQRPTGDETEPFNYMINPILDQMDSSHVPKAHQVAVLFSVLTGKARDAASKIRTNNTDVHEFTEQLAKILVTDHNIQQRKISRWNGISYTDFRGKSKTDHEATQRIIDHLTSHQLDLPDYLNNGHALLARLRDIFKDLSWCQSLYEKASPNQTPVSFGEMLKTAASNHDDRQRRKPATSTTSSFPVATDTQPSNGYQDLVAFFARTPPPPRFRRPRRYQRKSFNGYRRRLPRSVMRRMIRCFGCQQPGHIVRHCPEKKKYLDRLNMFKNIGTAALIVMEGMESDKSSEEADESAAFLAEFDDFEPDEDNSEFDNWLCELFHVFDSNLQQCLTTAERSSYYIKESITELSKAMRDLEDSVQFNTTNVNQHLLVDIGAPKSLCSEPWLRNAGWTIIKKVDLPPNMRPFRFASTKISAMYAACLVAELEDEVGRTHLLRQIAFVLPEAPIPYLMGLRTARELSFDIALREGTRSHLKINKFNSIHRLIVNSHAWLKFTPCSQDPDPNFDWEPLITSTIERQQSMTSFTFMEGNFETSVNIVPPWERDEWTTKLTETNLDHLHEVLRHPSGSTLTNLFRQQRVGRSLPKSLKDKIRQQETQCTPCAENPELPRKPKISVPHTATPNVSVSLDVMHKFLDGSKRNFLTMLDAGDSTLKLAYLEDSSAKLAYEAYLYRWISYFDAPVYTVVDRGSNLNAPLMANELRRHDSQLCPIPTEAPWSIGNNERSHRFIKRAMDKLISTPGYDSGYDFQRLIAEIEMAWNMTQHSNRTLPHFSRFGIMPRVLGELENSDTTQQRISLMELARTETERWRAEKVINDALSPWKRHLKRLALFHVNQKVWFHRRKFAWRVGTVTRIDRPTIFVEFNGKIFPTHENRVRPYFGENSLPPEIRTNDDDGQEVIVKPIDDTVDRATIPQLVNTTFSVREDPWKISRGGFILETDDQAIKLHSSTEDTGVIDSDEVLFIDHEFINLEATSTSSFLTTTNIVKWRKVSDEDRKASRVSMSEEIKFLLSEAIEEIMKDDADTNCELQPLKWVLAIKRSPTAKPPNPTIRHRARLVSASDRTELRFALNGTAPTIGLSTLRSLLAITPTWDKIISERNDSISIISRDVTKAYLLSMNSKRLVYYQPPEEYFEEYPDRTNFIWKAKVQLYGDVEAGKYWHKTFVPWLCENILDYQQSIFDPSLLVSSKHHAATALCTDDALTVIPASERDEEAKIAVRFKCRDAQELPVDFKGIDIKKSGENIVITQDEYAKSMQISAELETATKPELSRDITDEELKQLRSDAGKLAWIATSTSPTSSFQASVSLQRRKENRVTRIPKLQVLHDTRKILNEVKSNNLATLKFIPLHPPTTHIRIYTDGSYQNLETKHSQIGFIIGLADQEDNFNIVHWHSSRAPRRARSTEESELMALDVGLRSLENLAKIVFQLCKRDVPVVAYIDCETLWKNLMKETAMSIPEIGYRVREDINLGKVASVCLISGSANPADATTKAKPNPILKRIIATNKCITPAKNVFMLQDSPYRHLSWIPTMKVPMPDDR